MKNIVLIGMPASGKSTVGVILAKLLGYDFVDTDILLSVHEKRPLSQIIAEEGYEGFLKLEGAVGRDLACIGTVISTGGSMVFSTKAMENLGENGLLVWLDAPADELERRLSGSLAERGVATPQPMTISEIYEARAPLYQRHAQLRLPSVGSSEQVAATLKALLLQQDGFLS